MAKEKSGRIVDLTADDEGAAPGKAKKPAKPTKPAKTSEPKSDDEKKKKGGAGGVIFVLLLLALIGGFIFEEIQFNYLGTRDIFVTAVAKLDPNYKTWEELDNELRVWEAELDKREKSLDSREAQLDKRQEELDNLSEELDEKEESLTPIYRKPLNERELEDINSLANTYSQMAPASAAEILVRLYDSQDVAAVLYYMAERSAASILAEMDPAYAARITEILLYN